MLTITIFIAGISIIGMFIFILRRNSYEKVENKGDESILDDDFDENV